MFVGARLSIWINGACRCCFCCSLRAGKTGGGGKERLQRKLLPENTRAVFLCSCCVRAVVTGVSRSVGLRSTVARCSSVAPAESHNVTCTVPRGLGFPSQSTQGIFSKVPEKNSVRPLCYCGVCVNAKRQRSTYLSGGGEVDNSEEKGGLRSFLYSVNVFARPRLTLCPCPCFLFRPSAAYAPRASHLSKGVAILATIDLLYKGIWATFYATQQFKNAAGQALSQLEPFVSGFVCSTVKLSVVYLS